MDEYPISFARQLRKLAAADPGKIAARMGSLALTRGELDERSNRVARALQNRGLNPGDLLTIALPNGIAFIEVTLACWKAGVTPQPVSSRLPQAELDAIAELAESPFIVGQQGLISRHDIVFPEALLEESNASPLEDHISASWKAPTSGGSTGRPKLILAGQPSIYTPDLGALWLIGADDVAVMPGPLYHNAPFQTSAFTLLHGGTLVLLPKFDAEEVLRHVEAQQGTWLYLVPTMMTRIFKLPEAVRARYDLSSLRTLWHVAAPCPIWLKRAWIEWVGPDVVWEIYGATEGQAATTISGREWLKKPGSVGRVAMGEMKVIGSDGNELLTGEIGDIYERQSPGEPPSYHYRGAEPVKRADGWSTVGDIGSIDADGYVFLSDRRSDLILVGGANVYPAEVEAALEEHPQVRSCAVIGLPNDDLGQRIHAIVEAAGPLTSEDLLAHLSARLVRYKLPRSIEFVTVPLRDEAGKVRRSQLQAERIAAGRN